MLSYEILTNQGIVIIRPSAALQQKDFEHLTKDIDKHIEKDDKLKGIIIHTKSFPGWDGLGAFMHHMRFIKDHHRKIKRVAAVTDGFFLTIVPKIVNLFVSAEVKHFDYNDLEAARKWILKGSDNLS